jgi:hypothetical protein
MDTRVVLAVKAPETRVLKTELSRVQKAILAASDQAETDKENSLSTKTTLQQRVNVLEADNKEVRQENIYLTERIGKLEAYDSKGAKSMTLMTGTHIHTHS